MASRTRSKCRRSPLGNEVAWVSLPGEVFTELGLAIKQDSPFPCTIVAELANALVGYIPSRRAYPQGNYEVVSARCAEGSGERLVDAAVKILKALHLEAPGGFPESERRSGTSFERETLWKTVPPFQSFCLF